MTMAGGPRSGKELRSQTFQSRPHMRSGIAESLSGAKEWSDFAAAAFGVCGSGCSTVCCPR